MHHQKNLTYLIRGLGFQKIMRNYLYKGNSARIYMIFKFYRTAILLIISWTIVLLCSGFISCFGRANISIPRFLPIWKSLVVFLFVWLLPLGIIITDSLQPPSSTKISNVSDCFSFSQPASVLISKIATPCESVSPEISYTVPLMLVSSSFTVPCPHD